MSMTLGAFFRLLVRLVAAATLGFIVIPLLIIIPLSFSGSSLLVFPPPHWSLRWYAALFQDDLWMGALKNSLIVGTATALLATGLGTLGSMALVRPDVRGKAILMWLLISPMIVPSVITAVALFFMFSWMGIVGTYTALILGHTILAIPFVIIAVTASLQSFDRTQLLAGASLGGSPGYVFWTVTLPQILPGVATGAIFAFATSFDEVVLALFVGSPDQRTLPRQMFAGIRENISPTIASIATLLIIIATVLMVVLEWLRRRRAGMLAARTA